jgi:hypothetical protein
MHGEKIRPVKRNFYHSALQFNSLAALEA